ncbi:MAG: carboxypeptidase regulatory-like domain-containing protein, partial [Eudoraea sp.]|nr:carboxypeptidase-like regulatory domain-containing protein [Eudoraea sp.]NNJ39794.1 carboxypeptidase regulatory-like domain-containing protein [Eudoraea sp.]
MNHRFFFWLLLLCPLALIAQTANITGIVLDEEKKPLPDVNIRVEDRGTTTDANGFYLLEIIADTERNLVFSHLGHRDIILENLILTT